MSKIMNNIVDYINDDESMFDELFTKDEYEFVRKVVDELSPRESYIIKMYFGFNGKTYTQVEISKILGLSQSHISKIIKKTLEDITLKLVQFEYADNKIKEDINNILQKSSYNIHLVYSMDYCNKVDMVDMGMGFVLVSLRIQV